jgi:ribulose-phosphate 3-epimerase
MSVDPGFGGQAFLPEMLKKIDPLVAYRAETKKPLRIGMDGGITSKQIPLLKEKGVDDMVVGHELFSAADITQKIIELNKLAA